MPVWRVILGCLLMNLSSGTTDAGELPPGRIGVARRDITPDYPIRLTGYAARTNLAGGAAQRLWAKALALGSDWQGPRVLVTVDNCGVPRNVVEEVARRLASRIRLPRSRLAITSSHTHAGPMVRGFAENIFVRDLTPEEAAASDRYTSELTDHLEAVVRDALGARRPARLHRASGKVGFAANRRTPGGPVDHSLPILVATDPDGRVIAVVANYACHCTTLGHQVNQHHGDWSGFAQAAVETEHPGATALITIGCGADANPSPRGGDDFGIALARRHGESLAAEVKRLIDGPLEDLPVVPATRLRRLTLDFQTLPDRAEWEKRAQESGIVGYHARKNLERLGRGESLPTGLPYPVQTWRFGDRLALVFLAGEVVVDYALKLGEIFDPDRLWVTAYANDVPCYIPSRRILREGGYEAETSLWYYDRPARLVPETEDRILETVGRLLPRRLRAPAASPSN